MKKYNVSIRESSNDCWDSDSVNDYIEAENEEEAFRIAVSYLIDCACENGTEFNPDDYQFMVQEHTAEGNINAKFF